MARFVKKLEKEGFSKVQRGMYVRYCTTADNGRTHRRRIANIIEPRSTVCLLSVTDKEFLEIYSHFGSTRAPKKNGPNPRILSNFSDFFQSQFACEPA